VGVLEKHYFMRVNIIPNNKYPKIEIKKGVK